MWHDYKVKLIIKILKTNSFKWVLVFCGLFWTLMIVGLSHFKLVFNYVNF